MLHNALARNGLFAKLDRAYQERPAIFVIGPPGAGKTTTVASWLGARGIKGIWYQIDPGDADLATFFHYLKRTTESLVPPGKQSLPALTPEYLHDLCGFSRRFFRELFSRLPPGATLTLDNYQEVATNHELHRLISEAISEVPSQSTLILITRLEPPDLYARLIANEQVAFLRWKDLKLTLEEASAIVRSRCEAGCSRRSRSVE